MTLLSFGMHFGAYFSKSHLRYFVWHVRQLASADLFLQESQFLVYGNGRDKPPTSIMFDKQQIRALYFNQSPPKVRIDANT